jgi:anti-sigma B factor antagonist
MNVDVKTDGGVSMVKLSGDIDGSSAPAAQAAILPLAAPGCRILLDMTDVPYMSSAGLRMLLSTYRQVTSKNGMVVLVGLSENIQDTMAVTGFLKFFTVCDSVEAGLDALQSPKN